MKMYLLRRRRLTMFLTTTKLKFLDVKNYNRPGLIYDTAFMINGL